MRSIILSLIILTIVLASAGVIGSSGVDLSADLVMDIRLPRVITALFAGCATAVAGAMCQSLFRNPLATPSVIGTESGAAFALALATLWTFSQGHPIESLNPIVFTSIGAATSTLIAMSLMRFRASSLGAGDDGLGRILLGGFAINALLAAGTSYCVSILLDQGDGLNLYHWLMGSFSSRTWNQAASIGAIFTLGSLCAWRLAPTLDAFSLGEEGARSIGINTRRMKLKVLVIVALMIGGAMSNGGALPFIGLVAPHLARILSRPHFRSILPLSAIIGGTITVAADLLARTLRAPIDLDVGILTTMLGAPYFLWLLFREDRRC